MVVSTMKSFITLFVDLATIVNMSAAQHLQQELLSGADRMVFQTTFSQQWDQQSDIRIDGLAFFNRFYHSEKRVFDEAVIQTSATGSFSKHFSAGPNLFYSNVAGLQPGILLNAKFQLAGIDVKLSPQVAYNVPSTALQGGVALLVRKMVTVNPQWDIGANAFLMGSWLRFDTHDRSIIQARIGPVYQNRFQFGLSYDLDQYSPKILQEDQIGFFIRTLF
jgi:hypothetical protein